MVPAPKTGVENWTSTQPTIDPALKPFLPEIEAIKKLAKTEPKKAREKSNALLEIAARQVQTLLHTGF